MPKYGFLLAVTVALAYGLAPLLAFIFANSRCDKKLDFEIDKW